MSLEFHSTVKCKGNNDINEYARIQVKGLFLEVLQRNLIK